jgi:DNA repair protein RecO (recombination protein O)
VSRAAGEPYRDKLMRLPVFLLRQDVHQDVRQDGVPPSPDDLLDAFTLTGFFLDRHAFAPRGLSLPEVRAQFVNALTRAAQSRQTH